jgi:hypothetical protein
VWSPPGGVSRGTPRLIDGFDDGAGLDLPIGEDVGPQPASVDQRAEGACGGEALQMRAGLTQTLAQALDVADSEASPHQAVQVQPASDDGAARLGVPECAAVGQGERVEYLGLDEREVVATDGVVVGSEGACLGGVAVTVQASTGQGDASSSPCEALPVPTGPAPAVTRIGHVHDLGRRIGPRGDNDRTRARSLSPSRRAGAGGRRVDTNCNPRGRSGQKRQI